MIADAARRDSATDEDRAAGHPPAASPQFVPVHLIIPFKMHC